MIEPFTVTTADVNIHNKYEESGCDHGVQGKPYGHGESLHLNQRLLTFRY